MLGKKALETKTIEVHTDERLHPGCACYGCRVVRLSSTLEALEAKVAEALQAREAAEKRAAQRAFENEAEIRRVLGPVVQEAIDKAIGTVLARVPEKCGAEYINDGAPCVKPKGHRGRHIDAEGWKWD